MLQIAVQRCDLTGRKGSKQGRKMERFSIKAGIFGMVNLFVELDFQEHGNHFIPTEGKTGGLNGECFLSLQQMQLLIGRNVRIALVGHMDIHAY